MLIEKAHEQFCKVLHFNLDTCVDIFDKDEKTWLKTVLIYFYLFFTLNLTLQYNCLETENGLYNCLQKSKKERKKERYDEVLNVHTQGPFFHIDQNKNRFFYIAKLEILQANSPLSTYQGGLLFLARACGVPAVGVRAADCWQ